MTLCVPDCRTVFAKSSMTDREPAKAAGPMTTRSYRVQPSAPQQTAAEGEASMIESDQQKLEVPDTFVHQPVGGSRSMRFKQQQHAKQHAWEKQLEAFMHNQHPAPGRPSARKPSLSQQQQQRQALQHSPILRGREAILDAGLAAGLVPDRGLEVAMPCTGPMSPIPAAAPQQPHDHRFYQTDGGAIPAMTSQQCNASATGSSPQAPRRSLSPQSGAQMMMPLGRRASRARSSSPQERPNARVTAGGWHGHWQSARSRSPVAMPNLMPMSFATASSSGLPEQMSQKDPDRLAISDL